MKFPCAIIQRNDGQWFIRHVGKDAGTVEVTAASRAEAVAKMEDELRYRLEMCPCTGQAYKNLQIELVEVF
jgi:hypothetical protein